jgi:hypothetical protein
MLYFILLLNKVRDYIIIYKLGVLLIITEELGIF